MIRRLPQRLAHSFFRMRTMQRLALTYLVTFCIPLAVLLSLYYNQLWNRLADDYTAGQRAEVLRASNVYHGRVDSALSLATLFQQNPQFSEYVEGKYLQDSERITNYNVYVLPQITYVLRTNAYLTDIQIYSLSDSFIVPPYHFLKEWPEDAGPLENILADKNPLAGSWHLRTDDGRVESIACYIRLYNSNYSRPLGIICLTIDPYAFLGDIRAPSNASGLLLREGGNYFLLGEKGFYASEETPALEQFRLRGQDEETNIALLGPSLITHALPMEELGMELVFTTRFTLLSTKDVFTFLVPVLIALLLFTSIFFIHLSAGTGRILRLSHYLENADYNQLGRYPEKGYGDEVDGLIRSYNKLADNINLLINTVFQARIKSREAQYYALQAQVNPHFLLNTLENIHMMAVINRDEETAKMILMLGKIFQYNIDQNNISSTIDREVLHACNYLELCLMRMGKKLRYHISCEDGEVGPVTCPRNIIQPIVENFINHAFRNTAGAREINLDIRPRGEDIFIRVMDNGSGIEEGRLRELQRILIEGQEDFGDASAKYGVGVLNVHERLKLFYGDGYGLQLQNRPEGGAVCTLRLRHYHQLDSMGAELEQLDEG